MISSWAQDLPDPATAYIYAYLPTEKNTLLLGPWSGLIPWRGVDSAS